VSRHQRYSESELQLIRVEWDRGTRVQQIAIMLDRNPIALASRMARMALPPRRGRARNLLDLDGRHASVDPDSRES
jgi:hypothetical protein